MVKVIPVLDVMNGVVVHATAGIREKYRPLRDSVIVGSSNPHDLLKRLRDMGFDEVYIADLDSILGAGENMEVINKALSLGFNVLADIGVKGVRMKSTRKLELVIGTEYLSRPEQLKELKDRSISIDLYYGNVKFKNRKYSLYYVLKKIKNITYSNVLAIFLDLVGTFKGPNFKLIKLILDNISSKEVIVGGGIRGVEDLKKLENIGVSKVLVASALHKGIIVKPYYSF